MSVCQCHVITSDITCASEYSLLQFIQFVCVFFYWLRYVLNISNTHNAYERAHWHYLAIVILVWQPAQTLYTCKTFVTYSSIQTAAARIQTVRRLKCSAKLRVPRIYPVHMNTIRICIALPFTNVCRSLSLVLATQRNKYIISSSPLPENVYLAVYFNRNKCVLIYCFCGRTPI